MNLFLNYKNNIMHTFPADFAHTRRNHVVYVFPADFADHCRKNILSIRQHLFVIPFYHILLTFALK